MPMRSCRDVGFGKDALGGIDRGAGRPASADLASRHGPTSYGAAAPLDNPRQFRSQADDLRETLRQIEMEIAELPPSQRRRTPHPVIAHGHRLMDELGVGFVALVVAAPVIIFALIFARMLGILRY